MLLLCTDEFKKGLKKVAVVEYSLCANLECRAAVGWFLSMKNLVMLLHILSFCYIRIFTAVLILALFSTITSCTYIGPGSARISTHSPARYTEKDAKRRREAAMIVNIVNDAQ